MTPVDLPLVVLAVAFALTLVRSARGPTLADRLAATELGFAILVAAIGLLAVRLQSPEVLDVAVIAVLLQFISTSGLAYLLRHHEGLDREKERR